MFQLTHRGSYSVLALYYLAKHAALLDSGQCAKILDESESCRHDGDDGVDVAIHTGHESSRHNF